MQPCVQIEEVGAIIQKQGDKVSLTLTSSQGTHTLTQICHVYRWGTLQCMSVRVCVCV